MDSIDVIIPTFINVHTFWVIPRRSLLIRSAISRLLKSNKNEKIKDAEDYEEGEMVAVNINDIWARAIVKQVFENKFDKQFLCWLPDYGVMRLVQFVFYLPTDMKNCPHLARQASLHDVVNLMTELVFNEGQFEFQLKKTVNDVEGVRKVALDCIEEAKKLSFNVIDEDEFNIYGDIIFSDASDNSQSLTEFLIKKNLLGIDRDMFKSMQRTREQIIENYYSASRSWHQELDLSEKKNLPEIIFNNEENKTFPMEFFSWKRFNDNMANRYS